MLNRIWLSFILIGIAAAILGGRAEVVTRAVTEGSQTAVETALGLIGTIAFWMGLMRIAEDAGLILLLARIIRPFVRWLFPEVPANHPALGSILLNMSANLLGLGNAATPLGLKAMAQLQELNEEPDTATNSMCTLLAINTSGITLIPTLVIAARAAAGSKNPAEIVGTTIIATCCSTMAALTVDAFCRHWGRKKRGGWR
ncbi:MAG: nucleoside recognition domain-containing protein [bacterium]